MRFSIAAVLVTLAVVQATVVSMRHDHHHSRKTTRISSAEGHVRKPCPRGSKTCDNALANRDLIAPLDLRRRSSLPYIQGINANTNTAPAWIGSDGQWTNSFTNNAGEDLILVVWGPNGSWVNTIQPYITISLAPNASETISFAEGLSGAWSAIYNDTQMPTGQVSNTWGEFTFAPGGVVDVSRLPNMNGHDTHIIGPDCTADLNTCVFVCLGAEVCKDNYVLANCATGSQPGANNGTFEGQPSGGCGWKGAAAASLQTYFY